MVERRCAQALRCTPLVQIFRPIRLIPLVAYTAIKVVIKNKIREMTGGHISDIISVKNSCNDFRKTRKIIKKMRG